MCLHIFSFKWTNFFVSIDCSFFKITSYYWNPNLVLNSWADVVLQSIITLIANFSFIKILWTCFFGCYDLNYILLKFLTNFYLPLFLYHFFHMFFWLNQPFLYSVLYRSLRSFYFVFHFIIFLSLVYYLLKQIHHD